MSTSEQTNEIATALAKAQGEMKNAALNKINPHFKSRYADLAAIRDATLPVLSKFGLCVVQVPEIVQAGLLLRTRLLHSSGQWIDATYPLDVDLTKPQAIGSALSYARRYCLASICGIASEEDDDGEGAREFAGKSGNGDAKTRSNDPRFIYERLVNTMRSTKGLDALSDWKTRNLSEIGALPSDWHSRLIDVYQTHKATLPKAKKLSEQAIEADKPPMPDDEIPI